MPHIQEIISEIQRDIKGLRLVQGVQASEFNDLKAMVEELGVMVTGLERKQEAIIQELQLISSPEPEELKKKKKKK